MDIHVAALWLYVMFVSVLFGGALFERLVLVAVWASALPRSVRDWNANPGLILDPSRFFRFVSLPLIFLTPLMLYLAWSTPGVARARLLVSTVTLLAVLIATLAYYYPTLSRLTLHQGEGLDNDQLVRTARRWVALQYLRLALVAVAWLTALSAFRAGA